MNIRFDNLTCCSLVLSLAATAALAGAADGPSAAERKRS